MEEGKRKDWKLTRKPVLGLMENLCSFCCIVEGPAYFFIMFLLLGHRSYDPLGYLCFVMTGETMALRFFFGRGGCPENLLSLGTYYYYYYYNVCYLSKQKEERCLVSYAWSHQLECLTIEFSFEWLVWQ